MNEYFKNGYHIDRYYALEEDLLRFLNYITLEFYPKPQNQKYIRSIYLADLMLRIGSNVSIFFDKFIEDYVWLGEMRVTRSVFSFIDSSYDDNITELREERKKLESKSRWNGWNWRHYKKLEPILSLSNQYVLLIPLCNQIYPFRCDGKIQGKPWTDITAEDATYWWNSYNRIKHNATFNSANLYNVLQALSGLFLLVTNINLGNNFKKLDQYNYIKKESKEGVMNYNISSRLFLISQPIMRKPILE